MHKVPSEITVPPPELSESLIRFKSEHPNPLRVAFLMMRLQDTPVHKRISAAVRNVLNDYGIIVLRADDHQYHPDLYWNIITYIYGCGFGIAVFERVEEESFNPNVAFEVGYMLALSKPVCLLKERTLKTLQTDLVGKLYRKFDALDPEGSVPVALRNWLSDQKDLAGTYLVLSNFFTNNKQEDRECRRILVMLSPDQAMTKHEIRESLGYPGGDSDSPFNKRLIRLCDLGLIHQIEAGTNAGRYRVRLEVADLVCKLVERAVKW